MASNTTYTNDELLTMLNDASFSKCFWAGYMLVERKELRAVERILAMIDNPATRMCAIGLVNNFGVDFAFDALLKLLTHEDLLVRKAAIIALGNSGSEMAVDYLLEMISNDPRLDKKLQFAVLDAFNHLKSPRTLETVLQFLNSDNPSLVLEAAWCLGQIKDKRATMHLLELLNQEIYTPREACEIAVALGYIKDERAVDVLMTILNDSHPEFQLGILWSLGEIRDPRAIAPINTLLHQQPSEQKLGNLVVGSAIEALEKIGTPEALAAVEEWRKKQQ